MEIRISKTLLDTLLSKVYPIVPTRSTLPILSNILLEARGDKIYVSATDLETSATAIGSAEILKEGGIALNGKDLYNITRELPSTTIEIKADNLVAVLQCEKGKFSMAGIGSDEFPTLMEVGKEKKVNIPYALLQRAIDKTLFAVSGDTESPLGGVLLDLHQKDFRLVATDGHKLALFKNNYHIDKVTRLLVSSKVWREVAKFLSGVEVAFEENKIGFYAEDVVIVSRLMEGEFPPYESVLPTDNDKILIISKEDLVLALRRALVFAPEISKFIKLRLKSNTLLIETTSEAGESKEELPAKYDGAELEIAYNGSYLLNIINKIDTDEIKILFKDSESSAVVLPAKQKEDEEITYLLMPIRLE